MKKILLIAIVSVFLSQGFSQVGLNLDFETWTAMGVYDEPDGWETLNGLSLFGVPITVTKNTTSPAGGAASADLTTSLCTACPGFGLDTNLFGLIAQEIPVTELATTMDFDWKYTPVGSDSAAVFAEFTHYDTGIGDRVTDAVGFAILGANSTWMMETVAFFPLTTDVPDTLTIYATSSSGGLFGSPVAEIGSVLSVDNFRVNFPTTSLEAEYALGANVFTREGNLVVTLEEPTNATISVVDMTGKTVVRHSFNGDRDILDTRSFSSGVYVVNVQSNNGYAVTKKIFIR